MKYSWVTLVAVHLLLSLAIQQAYGYVYDYETRTEQQVVVTGDRVRSYTLYLNDYGFNASRGGPTLIGYQGEVIRIRLIGNGSGPTVHDFVLDANSPSPYNVKSRRLSRGQEQVIEFVAIFPGEFKYYCSVAPFVGQSHRERGQEATIVIYGVTTTQTGPTGTVQTPAATTTPTTTPQGTDQVTLVLAAVLIAAAASGAIVWLARSRRR